MIAIRRAEERGHFGQGWVDAYHTFSFDRYRDPEHTGFRELVALNDERVDPGFERSHTAPRDVEILSYVLEGDLAASDAHGHRTVVHQGEFRRVHAKGGEVRDRATAANGTPLHLLEFWLRPASGLGAADVESFHIADADKRGKLKLVASPDGRDGSMSVGTDSAVFVAALAEGDTVSHGLVEGRHAWVQVVRGSVTLNGRVLTAGDGAAASGEAKVVVAARSDAEIVLIDLA
ncbi:MAG: pirin family protein [Planctomycetes bacterium]|nr:pirin family protein [Planctomycetota bacterium]